jgi:hypothetical protein
MLGNVGFPHLACYVEFHSVKLKTCFILVLKDTPILAMVANRWLTDSDQ